MVSYHTGIENRFKDNNNNKKTIKLQKLLQSISFTYNPKMPSSSLPIYLLTTPYKYNSTDTAVISPHSPVMKTTIRTQKASSQNHKGTG